MLGTSPMCCRCVSDMFNLRVPHRTFADCCEQLGPVRRYITDSPWRRNIGKKCMHQLTCFLISRCLGGSMHGDYSRTSLIICRTIGAAQICVSRKLEKPHGPLKNTLDQVYCVLFYGTKICTYIDHTMIGLLYR